MSDLSIDNQVSIANDGYVNAGDLGDFSNGPYLLCHTDNVDCCSRREVPGREVLGEWYLPNGTAVGSYGYNQYIRGRNFFARHRGQSIVHLSRDGTPSERGRFHCEIPNADGVNKTVYANICKCLCPRDAVNSSRYTCVCHSYLLQYTHSKPVFGLTIVYKRSDRYMLQCTMIMLYMQWTLVQ